MQIAISLNDLKARDQAALNPPHIMGTLGTKRLPTFLQNPKIVLRVKGSYYVVNRVLYSYMYDYATSVYERKICCINTEISRFITTVFPQTVATTPHYSSTINRKGQEDQSLQRLLAIFPTIFLTQIECFAYIISHAYEAAHENAQRHRQLCHGMANG
jgi:hypothetical protein